MKSTNQISNNLLENDFTIEELFENIDVESQSEELNLVNKLLKKFAGQPTTAKNVNILELVKLRTTMIEHERKHAERMQKMRIERIKNQGFTLEEFSDAVTFLFKISSQFIPPERLEEFSNTVNKFVQEKSNSLKQK